MVEIMPDVSGRENRQLGDTFVSGPSHLEEESKGVREQVCRDEDNQPILHGDAAHQRVVEEISGLRGQVATEGIPREEKQPASSPSSAAASSVPSTTVASLIQSAAKISILDYDRPEVRRHSSTNEPMRLFQDDEYDDLESPSLKSLQKKVLPAIPDEQDRKRFVGCLAAVIASAYDYDEGERENDATNQSSNHQQILDSSYSNSFYDSMDDEEFFCSESIGSACSDGCNRPPSNRTRQRQHYQTSVPPRQSTHSKSMPTMGARVQNAAVLALTRHRKRRYDVFCRFLASTAELLGLDKMYGKGFLPILHKLLIPTASSAKDNQRRRAPDTRTFQPSGYASDEDFLERRINEIEHLRPFLEGLGPGAGLRCLAMFLLQHLLHSAEGYDARIRHAIKKLGVLVLLHDLMLERKEQQAEDLHALSSRPPSTEEITWMHSKLELEPADLVTLATRKYESLEQSIAMKLIELSVAQRQLEMEMSGRSGKRTKATSWNLASRETNGSSRDNILRGLKIGGTALAAGTLFAITGGLAAPGIAAGIAAIAGTTVVATAAAALTTTAAVTTIFGVGGGGLVAYKMQRRTIGLTEFRFCKETSSKRRRQQQQQKLVHSHNVDEDFPDAELFSTICISGWLRDNCDFQRPWGLSPSRPPIDDRLELLERFYSVHRPKHVPKCGKILTSWKSEERQLWNLIRQNYGRDPDHLFPLEDGPRFRGSLSHEQQEVVDQLFSQLGCNTTLAHVVDNTQKQQQTPSERIKFGHKQGTGWLIGDSLHDSHADNPSNSFRDESTSNFSLEFEDASTGAPAQDYSDVSKIKHLATVWDYQATYGGELYTVRWESDLLEELCDSVNDLAADVVTGATTHLLKFTALSMLVSAIALPVALKSAANMIDGTWTLVVERSDEAGRELAQSLMFSNAGNRPVCLVGFSFGARVIYSCLKELARYQENWEDYQDRRMHSGAKVRHRNGAVEVGSDAFYENMREPASIVGDAILMGLPNHLSLSSWEACRQVVAGRVVNCFSQKDLILSLMFQYKKFGLKPVCGTCPVHVPGVENFDVSDLVAGHQDYCFITGEILKRVRHGQPFESDNASLSLGIDEDQGMR